MGLFSYCCAVPREAHREYPTLKHVWVDGAYNGRVITNLEAETGLTIEMAALAPT
jgi:hypothetical protein